MPEDPGYDPKLKALARQVGALLRESDVGFGLVLISPTHSEYVVHPSPSWSAVQLGGRELRVRIASEEVGAERALELAEGTVHILAQFGRMATVYHELATVALRELEQQALADRVR